MNYHRKNLRHYSHGARRSLSNVKYTKIFDFYDLSLEFEGPLLTSHIHTSFLAVKA